MTDGVTIRRGDPADSRAAFDVFLPAVNDLARRLGAPWDPEPEELWGRVEPIFAMLAAEAAEWWVAEEADGGRLIGHARSIERDGLFELSEFFVLPDRQTAGVGRQLLERTFPMNRGDVRAIIATTDVRAQARYYQAGTAARFPILSLNGPPGVATGSGPLDAGLEAQPATPDDIGPMNELERSVLGFARGREFGWLLEHRAGFVYRRAGRLAGYAFIGRRGGIGPLAAAEPADLPGMLDHLERTAADRQLAELSVDVPGPNEVAIRHLLARRLKIDSFFTVFMSSRPFGQFDRFIGFSPPFVL